jgi:branched-chain amino acid transport system ATP-binding protein
MLLETRDLTVSFGGVHANAGVDVAVEPGSFVGLIGPNGAGKTTFIDAITGFTRPSAGRVFFDGDDITDAAAFARARRGLARTFQSIELFEDLTVFDNVVVGAQRSKWFHVFAGIVHPSRNRGNIDDVEWALDLLGLLDQRDRPPADLSHGQRKLVGVARALAARPKLVLLDEPAAGLDTSESRSLGVDLCKLPAQGTAVLLIDHDMELVLDVCDYLYVIDFGRIIARGTPREIRRNPDVVAAYLGANAEIAVDGRASLPHERELGA